jgi:hypothetical protein
MDSSSMKCQSLKAVHGSSQSSNSSLCAVIDYVCKILLCTPRSMKQPLGVGRGLRGREDGGNVHNVQYKSNWNCYYESPPTPYNEYILIKIYNTKESKWINF